MTTPMILHCPECSARHIDEGEFAMKEHTTHACQECGFVWRPAVVSTIGVRFLPGFKNGEPALAPSTERPARDSAELIVSCIESAIVEQSWRTKDSKENMLTWLRAAAKSHREARPSAIREDAAKVMDLAPIPFGDLEHAAVASAINYYYDREPSLDRTMFENAHRWLDAAAAALRESKTPSKAPVDLRVATPLNPKGIVFQQIAFERERQDKQWGGRAHDDAHQRKDWFDFIREHESRGRKALGPHKCDLDEYRKQLIEIAALAVAAVESHDRKLRPGPVPK